MIIPVSIVLLAIHLVPSECSLYGSPDGTVMTKDGARKLSYCIPGTLGRYDTGPDTWKIAEAVSERAEDLHDAVEAVSYSSWESDNTLDAVGDCTIDAQGNRRCRSKGAWQIQTARELATALDQLDFWMVLRNNSRRTCNGTLQLLTSGSCFLAPQKTKKRAEAIDRIVIQIQAQAQSLLD